MGGMACIPKEDVMQTRATLVFASFLLSLPTLIETYAASLAASRFQVVPLVSDQPGVAPNTDPNLVNSWGLARVPGGTEVVADNGTDRATQYRRDTGNEVKPTIQVPGAPTGAAFVPTGSGFEIRSHGIRGPARFLFDTEAGTIEGWNAFFGLPNKAVLVVDNSAHGSVYKGLALDPADKLLFTADFANNQIEVYDNHFNRLRRFTDGTLPSRFAPFNVAWINGKLYVAFAKREKGGDDEEAGKGLGYIDVFDVQGNLIQRLVSQGLLNAPWGMTIGPKGFGPFAGSLLVGNFGDGKIHAYDPDTGAFNGTVRGNDGSAIVIDGLWALEAGPKSNVTFTAGPDDETHGLLGLIAPLGPTVATR
jgi:uncharacterized protein (TIGR03118 family)